MKPLTVRAGTGDNDRFTTFPATLTPVLQNHLAGVRPLHQQDLAQGHGKAYLPHALERTYPHAPQEWGWPEVFPARDLSVDPRAGVTRRHQVDPSVVNKAIKEASAVPVRRSPSAPTPVARPPLRTCAHAAPTSAPFGTCSGITILPPPCFTPTSCSRVARAF
jgi:hypothetical protein